MNTPAHVILNALLLGRGRWQRCWFAITSGALMPDLPMIGFYFYQRFVLERSEALIWSRIYFEPHWQTGFDLFNSLPLIGVGVLIAWWARSTSALAFFVSMGVHCLADLPLHREDAHAHFFPLSSWRFRSSISYWDPRHYGLIFAGVEAVLVVGGAIALTRPTRTRAWRCIAAITLVLYVAFGAFVFARWGP